MARLKTRAINRLLYAAVKKMPQSIKRYLAKLKFFTKISSKIISLEKKADINGTPINLTLAKSTTAWVMGNTPPPPDIRKSW